MVRTRIKLGRFPSRFYSGFAGLYTCCCLVGSAALLGGCASDGTSGVPIRDEAIFHVRLVDKIDYKPGAEAYGLSRCSNGVCEVELLRDHYPYCLGHEIRHIFEGQWHPGRETLEGC